MPPDTRSRWRARARLFQRPDGSRRYTPVRRASSWLAFLVLVGAALYFATGDRAGPGSVEAPAVERDAGTAP